MEFPGIDELLFMCRYIITMLVHGSLPGQSQTMPKSSHRRKWRQWLLVVNLYLVAQLVPVDLVQHLSPSHLLSRV